MIDKLYMQIINSKNVSSVEYWAGTSLLNIVPRKGVALSLY